MFLEGEGLAQGSWIFAAAKTPHLSDDEAVAKMGHPDLWWTIKASHGTPAELNKMTREHVTHRLQLAEVSVD